MVSPSHADRTVQMYVGKYGDGLATSSLAALPLVEPLKIDGWYDEWSLKIGVGIHQISGGNARPKTNRMVRKELTDIR